MIVRVRVSSAEPAEQTLVLRAQLLREALRVVREERRQALVNIAISA